MEIIIFTLNFQCDFQIQKRKNNIAFFLLFLIIVTYGPSEFNVETKNVTFRTYHIFLIWNINWILMVKKKVKIENERDIKIRVGKLDIKCGPHFLHVLNIIGQLNSGPNQGRWKQCRGYKDRYSAWLLLDFYNFLRDVETVLWKS